MTYNRLKRQMLNPLVRDILVEKATMESRKDSAPAMLAIDAEGPGE
jgi:hypothetical protein